MSDERNNDPDLRPRDHWREVAALSDAELVRVIEGSGFEDKGGPLARRLEWIELVRRLKS